MNQLLRSKGFKSIQSKNTLPPLPPELLELIFLYLNQHTLRRRVSLVCRQWNSIAQPFILTQKRIQLDKLRQQLSDLGFAQDLTVQTSGSTQGDGIRDESQHWIELTEHLERLAENQNTKLRNLRILQPIQNSLLNPILAIVGLLLTSLELRDMEEYYVPIGCFLSLCPQIAILDLHHRYTGCAETLPRGEIGPGHHQAELPSRLRLQSLTLRRIGIGRTTLLRLVGVCPDLEGLRLVQLPRLESLDNSDGIAGPTNDDNISLFRDSFLEYLSYLHPHLKSIHFSNAMDPLFPNPTSSQMAEALRLFPLANQWSFHSHQLTSTTFQAIRAFNSITLTTIEVIAPATVRSDLPRLLHEFLCEYPHLLHLKAPDVKLSPEWFDLEGILDLNGSYHHEAEYGKRDPIFAGISIAPFHRRIWACRNLRTLHMSFHVGGMCLTSTESSRLLFGYISKVCPRLQDLRIRHGGLNLSHKGGLCLLSRLHELRRLEIATEIIDQPWNIDWTARNMSAALAIKMKFWITIFNLIGAGAIFAKYPFESTAVVSKSPYQHGLFGQYIEDRAEHGSDNNGGDGSYDGRDVFMDGMNSLTPSLDYMISGLDMRNLGRLKDIANLFHDRLSENWSCWPHMEYLEINPLSKKYHSKAKFMKEALMRYRPEIEIVIHD
ncbi:hypothetical protein BGX27_004696 [Mortierella sp. AM989]|nr:hypothetical protein BGX27_004696 [Mortierella sp. AM989]